MKKIIQICSMLSLAFILSVGFAKAQTVNLYSVQVPFDFNVGQKSYQAGSYFIKVVKTTSDAVTFSLTDHEKNNLQTILVAKKGDVSKGKPKLVFNRYDNRRFLSKLSADKTTLSLAMTDEEKRFAGKREETPNLQTEE